MAQWIDFLRAFEWKQCAPSGVVRQRFGSVVEAFESFVHNRVIWPHDLYLKRMGKQMELHRSADNYRPTAMKVAEAQGAPIRRIPWENTLEEYHSFLPGPRCKWPAPGSSTSIRSKCESEDIAHQQKRFHRFMATAH